ncbi:MAG: GTP cyclohydrolase II [Pseudomonadota bacterium]
MGDPVNRKTHIRLTSHPGSGKKLRFPINWGAKDPRERGPIVGTVTETADRNVIGTHGGSYSLYRALAVTSGALNPIRRPDLTNTAPTFQFGPFPSWTDPKRIVSLDPWGHLPSEIFADLIAEGVDIRPTIAVTQARLTLHELKDAVREGRLTVDGSIVLSSGDVAVTKVAVEPVWHLPGLAERFDVEETRLRRVLFEQTGGMYPELVTRPDLHVFMPPIGSITGYIFGDPEAVSDTSRRLACRVHDECNGSDVFGSDICTCRPYLVHGIEECIREAQAGGGGLVVYNRKEGRALGEVTKFLVYNARKRQEGGDTASEYFERTECVAGVQDARFQELMPDVLHWLGVKRIDRFVSMSNMKYDAIVGSGIEIVERISIPDELIPADAQVEIEAKKAAGYYSETDTKDLKTVLGRDLNE